MTKRRIEILVDAEFTSDEHFENSRWLLEKLVHQWCEPYWGKHVAQVQANEAEL